VGLVAARFLHIASAAMLFGAALFALYARRPSKTIQAVAALVALLSGLAWLAFTTAAITDNASDALSPSAVWLVLSGTGFGTLWQARLAVAGAALLLLLLPSRPWLAWAQAFVAALLLASLAGTGHALEGEPVWLHVTVDMIHMWTAPYLQGLWAMI
jgi:putative copper export protein